MRAQLPIQRRMIVLAAIAAVGSVLFLPVLAAGSHQPLSAVAGFAVVATLAATLAAWPGLRCADRVGVPMPYLRRLDGGAADSPPRALWVSLAWGAIIGLATAIGFRVVHAPILPGDALARILSTVFVAGTLHIVIFLAILSIVTWIARGRHWVGILASTAAFVLLQSTGGALDHPVAVILVASGVNAVTGLVAGWLSITYGVEFAAACRALAYLIPVLAM